MSFLLIDYRYKLCFNFKKFVVRKYLILLVASAFFLCSFSAGFEDTSMLVRQNAKQNISIIDLVYSPLIAFGIILVLFFILKQSKTAKIEKAEMVEEEIKLNRKQRRKAEQANKKKGNVLPRKKLHSTSSG